MKWAQAKWYDKFLTISKILVCELNSIVGPWQALFKKINLADKVCKYRKVKQFYVRKI